MQNELVDAATLGLSVPEPPLAFNNAASSELI